MLRRLREWREKRDGTLEGPALHTEDTRTTQLDRHKRDGSWRERWQSHGRMVDDFEDLSPWSATHGTIEADSTEVYRGSQSMKVEADSDGIEISRDIDLDLRHFSPAIAIRVESDNEPRFEFEADDGTGTTARYEVDYYGADTDPGWYTFDFVLQGYSDSLLNSPSRMEGIENIEISTEDEDATVWLDALQVTRLPTPGKIVLGFDTQWQGTYDYAKDVLGEYGYSAVLWINSELFSDRGVEDDDYMSLAEVQELQEEYGWVIGSHEEAVHDELQGEDAETQREGIETEVRRLQRWGFHEGARHIAFTNNRYDDSLMDIVSEYHATAASASRGLAAGAYSNPLTIQRLNADNGLLEVDEEDFDWMAEFGGVGCIYFHADDVGESDLRDVLDEIKQREEDGDLEVIDIDDIPRSLPEWHQQKGSEQELRQIAEETKGEKIVDTTFEQETNNEVELEDVPLGTVIEVVDARDDVFLRFEDDDSSSYNYRTEQLDGTDNFHENETEFQLLSETDGPSGEWEIRQARARAALTGEGTGAGASDEWLVSGFWDDGWDGGKITIWADGDTEARLRVYEPFADKD